MVHLAILLYALIFIYINVFTEKTKKKAPQR